jgi:hypothetical protein
MGSGRGRLDEGEGAGEVALDGFDFGCEFVFHVVFGRGGGGWCGQAQEVAVDAEPHLVEDDFVALELAVGLVDGELFVDGEFVESGGGEVGLHPGLEAANVGELPLGMIEFSG